jgi:hypothetical protein
VPWTGALRRFGAGIRSDWRDNWRAQADWRHFSLQIAGMVRGFLKPRPQARFLPATCLAERGGEAFTLEAPQRPEPKNQVRKRFVR